MQVTGALWAVRIKYSYQRAAYWTTNYMFFGSASLVCIFIYMIRTTMEPHTREKWRTPQSIYQSQREHIPDSPSVPPWQCLSTAAMLIFKEKYDTRSTWTQEWDSHSPNCKSPDVDRIWKLVLLKMSMRELQREGDVREKWGMISRTMAFLHPCFLTYFSGRQVM